MFQIFGAGLHDIFGEQRLLSPRVFERQTPEVLREARMVRLVGLARQSDGSLTSPSLHFTVPLLFRGNVEKQHQCARGSADHQSHPAKKTILLHINKFDKLL